MGFLAVLDCGGQYAHLIANRIRRLGVEALIFEPEHFVPAEHATLCGIVISGGPRSVDEEGAPQIGFAPRAVGVPVLGICYGHQLVARACGGRVERGTALREYGFASIDVRNDAVLFAGLGESQRVWMSHGDHVAELPPDFRATASSAGAPVAAYESTDRMLHGVQFHPEVVHTADGNQMLAHFIALCCTERNWNAKMQVPKACAEIARLSAGNPLLVLISGGVDSLVAWALCVKAIGAERVFGIHVDTGLMRLHESAAVVAELQRYGCRHLKLIDAEKEFLLALTGVCDPEEKRRIIGDLFAKIADEAVTSLGLGEQALLVQGTIYPDTIESGGTKNAEKIKTHHNRSDVIKAMIAAGRVIEPLHDFYKDEVRAIGVELGLPIELVERQPFPGPGLGVRFLCSAHGEAESGYDREESAIRDAMVRCGFQARVLPIKSVGVQGDGRSYAHPVLLIPEAGVIDLTHEAIRQVTAAIINRFTSVNRVVVSLFGVGLDFRPIRATINKSDLDLLRQVDAVISEECQDLLEIWQMPIVILPLVDECAGRVFVARPVSSIDAMTADFVLLPVEVIERIHRRLEAVPGFGTLLLDVTSKPPGTIEWE